VVFFFLGFVLLFGCFLFCVVFGVVVSLAAGGGWSGSFGVYESGLQRSLRCLYRRYLWTGDHTQQVLSAELMEWGWPQEQLAYVPNYVDTARFHPSYVPETISSSPAALRSRRVLQPSSRPPSPQRCRFGLQAPDHWRRKLRGLPGAERVQWLGFCAGEALWQQVREARALVLPRRVV
jgi:hypothetical protein